MDKIEAVLLKHSMKGQIAQSTTTIIAAAVSIFIGIWVLSMIMNSISQSGWSAAANTTYTTVQTTTWNAIQLLSVGLVVLAAAIILTYFGFGRTA